MEVGTSSGIASRAAEECKYANNDVKYMGLGLLCIPVAVKTHPFWGTEAKHALSQSTFS